MGEEFEITADATVWVCCREQGRCFRFCCSSCCCPCCNFSSCFRNSHSSMLSEALIRQEPCAMSADGNDSCTVMISPGGQAARCLRCCNTPGQSHRKDRGSRAMMRVSLLTCNSQSLHCNPQCLLSPHASHWQQRLPKQAPLPSIDGMLNALQQQRVQAAVWPKVLLRGCRVRISHLPTRAHNSTED
jgi:hypothetical protein